MKKRKKKYDEFFDNYVSITPGKPLKTLYLLLRGRIKNLAIASIIFVFKNSPIWLMPIVIANVINVLSNPEKHNKSEILINFLVISVSLILNIPLHMLYTKYVSSTLRNMEAGLRATLIRKMQMLSIQYYKDLLSGRLQSKILRDVEQIQNLVNILMNMLVPAVSNIIISITIALYKNWIVALFYILVSPVTSTAVVLLRKEIRSRNKDFRRELENMTSNLAEMVEMIPLTRAHGLEDEEIGKMDSQLDKVEKRGYRLDIVNALFGSTSFVVMYVFQLLCLLFTGYLALTKKIEVGDVVLFQTFFNQIVGQFSMLLSSFPQFASGFESVSSISEILTADDIEHYKGKPKITNIKGSFEFEDLYYKYPDAEEDDYILKGFSLKVEPGESVAFVGESGAGKSTLLNILIGYDMPTKGTLKIDGKRIEEINLKSYRRQISVVPQNNILFSGSIKDNITYGLSDISDERLQNAMDMANVTEFLDKLPDGLETNVGEHGGKISGGQRQRIAIARALIRDPRIIVFDEATSALDSHSEAHVQKAINSMLKDRTTFIVAHRLSTVKEADKIVVVKDGVCVECGNYQELMEKKGEFYHLKKLQS